jgi:hypothetical protein
MEQRDLPGVLSRDLSGMWRPGRTMEQRDLPGVLSRDLAGMWRPGRTMEQRDLPGVLSRDLAGMQIRVLAGLWSREISQKC